ncbi:response regulator [Streptomyces lavendulocolor]|uniref:response regulator n=1 Tax=Streptomyces lavendulocolor TaxID=67316 RepID=UPI00340A15DD
MSEALWIKVIGTVPAVLWVAFAATVYLTLRGTIIDRMVPRLTAVRAMGVEVELAGELLDRAQEERPSPDTPTARRTALGRLAHAGELLPGGRILWVDDHPEGNTPLVQLFRAAGMHVDLARSTEEAAPLLRRRSYDVLITDMGRHGDPRAGITLLRLLDEYDVRTPALVYTGSWDPERGVDRRLFAGTTVPTELVHFVIDLMERSRLGSL